MANVMTRALQRPARTAVILAGSVVVAVVSLVVGDRAFDEGWGSAPWLAWPAGVIVFVLPGLLLWLLLLVPSGRIEGPWTRRSASVVLWAVGLGSILQLLDDHVLNHAGTDNPLGFSIPSPFQDLSVLAALVFLAVGVLGTIMTMPGRISKYRSDEASS